MRTTLITTLLLSTCIGAAMAEPQSPPTPKEKPVTQTLTHPPTLRRETGPGMSEGPLSARFPEIELKISSSFAHDRGMTSSIESLTVDGVETPQREVLQKLVALRKGWTRTGGRSPEEALAVFEQFNEDWYATTPHSPRVTLAKLPISPQGMPDDPSKPLPAYHPPRFELRKLEDGDHVVLHSYFMQWDGGNHGTQTAYQVEAYRVSTGAPYKLP